MLVEVESDVYKKLFPKDPHPFVSLPFIEINQHKVDKVLFLTDDQPKPGIGMVAGIRDGVILSPFSAPFGGLHFRKEILHISEIDSFIVSLKEFILGKNLKGIDLVLPPDIYHQTFNAKLVNSLFRNDFEVVLPEITNWVDLTGFQERFTQKNSKEYLRQAVRNELSFESTDKMEDKQGIYELISENRARFGRPIFMDLNDILKIAEIWPVDFFKVLSREKELVAAAIIYRSHPDITFALFWGDNENGRPLRAMDFLSFELWKHYKNEGYSCFDLGISTESGFPNEGLLRFKESHEAMSSVRHKFRWYNGR